LPFSLISVLLLIPPCVGDAKRVGDASSVDDGLAGDTDGLAGWPVDVIEVGMVQMLQCQPDRSRR